MHREKKEEDEGLFKAEAGNGVDCKRHLAFPSGIGGRGFIQSKK
jgi:hypothetical protein